jgi:glycosyltransferase involved in cell wall biosynthesis
MDRLGATPTVSVVVLTYNRCHLLRQCVERVLWRTSPSTTEILIWDNASTDDTAAYLDSLTEPRLRVVHHPVNIGLNAYRLACAQTSGTHLIELDDDVICAPPGWDHTLLEAYELLPDIGYLAAGIIDDGHSIAADLMFRQDCHKYRRRQVGAVALLEGPTGGWCSMTSRDVYDRVGGFRQHRRMAFWREDGTYIADIGRLGYRAAILDDLKVFHASGPYYSPVVAEKEAFYATRRRRQRRRDAAKRAVLRVPGLAALNQRAGWFQAPTSRP